jgi:hypothetical protein
MLTDVFYNTITVCVKILVLLVVVLTCLCGLCYLQQQHCQCDNGVICCFCSTVIQIAVLIQ